MIPPERLKRGLALFNRGGVTHIIGDLYSVSTKGGQYKVYVNSSRWSCNCVWGGAYSGGWTQVAPCYHAIAAAALADIDVPLGDDDALDALDTNDADAVRRDDDPFEGLNVGY